MSVSLPSDRSLARLLCRVWKRELRLWWAAWTEGFHILEPRSWRNSSQQFHVWCVSSGSGPLRVVEASEAAQSMEAKEIVLHLHSRKLVHGSLYESAFFRGSEGFELAPPLNKTILAKSLKERMEADEGFFVGEYPDERASIREPTPASEVWATLSAEALSFYELTYYCQVEKEKVESFPADSVVLRLFRKEPHPTMGPLRRMSASSFYLSMLREMEGEQLGLVLSPSTDPFETKGAVVPVIGVHPNDEDCLVILPDPSKKFRFEKGWCHPRDLGTAKLMTRKRHTLSRAVRRRHIVRWINLDEQEAQKATDRRSLPAAILRNEGVYCVQGPPGTGKTHLACDVIGALLEEDEDARVLVCAKEHQALGILRQKLLQRFKDRMDSHVLVSQARGKMNPNEEGTSFAWAKGIVRKEPGEDYPSSWREAILEWKGQPPPILERLYEDSAQVVFATTTSWPMNARRFSHFFEPFDFVVVEEAGKCYPSEILAPLALSRRALLIGDQNQLPPFQLEETQAAVEHLREMMNDPEPTEDKKVEELVGGLDSKVDWDGVKSWLQPFANLQRACPSFMLQDQYRMVPLISDLIGGTFYSTRFVNRRSEDDCKPLFHHPLLKDMSLVWIDVPYWADYSKAREDLTGHRFNRMEMAIVAKLFREVQFGGSGTPNISILSPYNAQVDRLAGNKGLTAALPDLCDGVPGFNPRDSVKTVDSFQGNEADLVVVSLVRNNPFGNPHNAWGFVLNPERLNVMLSRARRHLVVIGCSRMIDLYSTYDEVKPLVSVLRYFREHGQTIDARDLGVVVP
ncbi:MAG: AAA family ATPase [Thaumarchaeota archaeon]|nr:AAA family ATPase [Nitrososphaerota archaeon]